MSKKVVVIGLDGATYDLILPWVAEGLLPTFKYLLENGTYGYLKSTIPFATIPAWPTFSTGCNPGKHGFYDSFIQKKNSYEWTVELNPSKAIKQPTIWEILSNSGKTVAVINVPSTFPPTPVNGYIITGMLTPPGAKYTYPTTLKKELEREIGKYNVFFSQLSSKNIDLLLEDLYRTFNSRVNAMLYLMKKNPDFTMMVDNGTDRAEHVLWRFIDTENPLYNPKMVEKYGNPLLKYYQEVDRGLKKIIDTLDKDTILMLMSDHGQGKLRKFINLNMLLIRENLMYVKNGIVSKLRYFLFNHGFTPHNLYRILEKIGIERFISTRVGRKRILSFLDKIFFSTLDIDWSKTKAFSSGITGGICINVVGKYSQGIINPGKEYDDLRTKIINILNSYHDPESGEKIVDAVYKREDLYHGHYLYKAADIVVTPQEGYEFFGMYGFSFNKILVPTFGNSGSHRSKGIFLVFGSGIAENKLIENARIEEIAPTILYIMGRKIPMHMDGRILNEIFDDKSIFRSNNTIHEEEKAKLKNSVKELRRIGKI